ncbi:MAG: serine hydrolase [Pseudomonadota bacterium]
MPRTGVFLALPLAIALLVCGCTAFRISDPHRRLDPPQLQDQLRTDRPSSVELNTEKLTDLITSIENDKHKDLNSVLIARNGTLVMEAYFNGETRDTLHDIRSAGKSITATLVGIAIHDGFIDSIDQRVLGFFPEYLPLRNKDPRKRKITIRYLLTMRSGFHANDRDSSTPGNEGRMTQSNDWIKYSLNVPMKYPPGQNWRYAGMNTLLLSGIVRMATSMPVDKYLEIRLLKPLGIENYFWKKTPMNRVVGQGNLFLRPRDMLKVGLLFLKNGVWNGMQIVPASWIHESTQPHTLLGQDAFTGYGYQWWTKQFILNDKSIPYFYASGNGGQRITVIPKLQMVVVITSSAYGERRGHTRSDDILKAIFSSVDAR